MLTLLPTKEDRILECSLQLVNIYSSLFCELMIREFKFEVQF